MELEKIKRYIGWNMHFSKYITVFVMPFVTEIE